MNVIGDVAGYTCILIDDIVNSGGTLVNAADALLANGAKEVYAYITHGVLSGGAAARIAGSKLKELVITDSIQPTEAVARRHQHPHAVDRLADRRSDRPHRGGRVGVEPVRLNLVSRTRCGILHAAPQSRDRYERCASTAPALQRTTPRSATRCAASGARHLVTQSPPRPGRAGAPG